MVDGGLIRSLGDWSQVISQCRETYSSEARLLGSSDFVDRVLSEVEGMEEETLRLSVRKIDLTGRLAKICEGENIDKSLVRSGSRQRAVAKARKILRHMANLEELSEIKRYVKLS